MIFECTILALMDKRVRSTTFGEKIEYNFPQRGNQGHRKTGIVHQALQTLSFDRQSIVNLKKIPERNSPGTRLD